MLAAMITGDRVWLQRRTRVGFERTGSFHLLVVSGLHLAIFAGLIFWLAQRLRLPRLWATLLTIVAALAYAVFTGYGQPVQRSFWMVTLYLLARLLWRERSALNAIGFAAHCLLAANPASLFDAGFQMTLLSVIAIAGIAMPLAEGTFAPYLRANTESYRCWQSIRRCLRELRSFASASGSWEPICSRLSEESSPFLARRG